METNEMIAAFMGMKRGVIIDGIGYYHNDELEYHESWDWLMPVVEKIDRLNHDVIIYSNGCKIIGEDFSINCRINAITPSKINTVFMAVGEFVKHYNSTTHQ